MAEFEIYLTDDAGKRIMLMDKAAFFSYSRAVSGFGTCQLGIPYREFKKAVNPVFAPDRRLEFWRSPAQGYPLRLEGVYFLREPKIYTRETDNVQIIEFFGRSSIDLLARRWVIQAAGTTYTAKSAALDDMMKEIVREQMLWGSARDETGTLDDGRAYPESEFSVQGDLTLGPVLARRFADRNVLDVLKELKDTTFQMNEDDPTNNRKIYFDIVPRTMSGIIIYIQDEETGDPILGEDGLPILDEESSLVTSGTGFQFVTFADLRGIDRTDKLVFSVENSNLTAPFYARNHFDEKNSIIVKGAGRGESRRTIVVDDTARVNASRWNRCEVISEASYEVDDSDLDNVGAAKLKEGQPRDELYATFLNTPGSTDAPRSLYGIDWDLGDLVPVWYADQTFECEIVVVYVGVDENGVETITGRNTVEVIV